MSKYEFSNNLSKWVDTQKSTNPRWKCCLHLLKAFPSPSACPISPSLPPSSFLPLLSSPSLHQKWNMQNSPKRLQGLQQSLVFMSCQSHYLFIFNSLVSHLSTISIERKWNYTLHLLNDSTVPWCHSSAKHIWHRIKEIHWFRTATVLGKWTWAGIFSGLDFAYCTPVSCWQDFCPCFMWAVPLFTDHLDKLQHMEPQQRGQLAATPCWGCDLLTISIFLGTL